MDAGITRTRMWISHLELMTLNGLMCFIDSFLKSEEGIMAVFSQEGILSAIQNET